MSGCSPRSGPPTSPVTWRASCGCSTRDAVYRTDGGGRVSAARRFIVGGERIARVPVHAKRWFHPASVTVREIGGAPCTTGLQPDPEQRRRRPAPSRGRRVRLEATPPPLRPRVLQRPWPGRPTCPGAAPPRSRPWRSRRRPGRPVRLGRRRAAPGFGLGSWQYVGALAVFFVVLSQMKINVTYAPARCPGRTSSPVRRTAHPWRTGAPPPSPACGPEPPRSAAHLVDAAAVLAEQEHAVDVDGEPYRLAALHSGA